MNFTKFKFTSNTSIKDLIIYLSQGIDELNKLLTKIASEYDGIIKLSKIFSLRLNGQNLYRL